MSSLKVPAYLSLILLCLGCGRVGYTIRSESVTYGQKDPAGYIKETELPGADPATFEVIYGKDKNNRYAGPNIKKG